MDDGGVDSKLSGHNLFDTKFSNECCLICSSYVNADQLITTKWDNQQEDKWESIVLSAIAKEQRRYQEFVAGLPDNIDANKAVRIWLHYEVKRTMLCYLFLMNGCNWSSPKDLTW